MSAFDARIRVGEASVQVLKESEDSPGLEAELVLGVLALAPVAANQAIPIPLGQLRVPLDKGSVDALAAQLSEASKDMKEKSDITVATSLEGVDQVAAHQNQLKA